MPLISTPQPAPSDGTAMRVTDMPPVDGIIESIDLKTGLLTIKDRTPLEATIEFFFDANATFTPLAGQPARINPRGRLPFTVGEAVEIEWTRTPATGSKKVIVSILERR
jgi:hypothetical protein